jgi:hypothetical protein
MKTKKEEINQITDAFLRCPLPESVCCDTCATKQGGGRIGTNLLTFTETKQMLEQVVGPTLKRLAELEAQREEMCVFITRLCRQIYKLGVRNKLTDGAMDYINKTDAESPPAAKMLRKIAALNAEDAK